MSAYAGEPRGSLIRFTHARDAPGEAAKAAAPTDSSRVQATLNDLIRFIEELRAAEGLLRQEREALESQLARERAQWAQQERAAREREAGLIAELDSARREI